MASQYTRWTVYQRIAGEWIQHYSSPNRLEAEQVMKDAWEACDHARAFALYREDLPSPKRRKLKREMVYDLPAECDI